MKLIIRPDKKKRSPSGTMTTAAGSAMPQNNHHRRSREVDWRNRRWYQKQKVQDGLIFCLWSIGVNLNVIMGRCWIEWRAESVRLRTERVLCCGVVGDRESFNSSLPFQWEEKTFLRSLLSATAASFILILRRITHHDNYPLAIIAIPFRVGSSCVYLFLNYN